MDNSFQQIEYYDTCPKCGVAGRNKEKCEKCGETLIKSVSQGYFGRFQNGEDTNYFRDYYEENESSLDGIEPKKHRGIWLVLLCLVAMLFGMIFLGVKFVHVQRQNTDSVSNTIEEIACIIENEADRINIENDRVMFNGIFEFYVGSQDGMAVSFVLDNIVKNSEVGERGVMVIYGESIASEGPEVLAISNSLDAFEKYDVSLKYDSEGYVSEIIIK